MTTDAKESGEEPRQRAQRGARVKASSRRHFGSVRKRGSGRWEASYWYDGERHTATRTFDAKADALAYLSTVEADILRGAWVDPAAGRITFAELRGQLAHSAPRSSSSNRRGLREPALSSPCSDVWRAPTRTDHAGNGP